MPWPAELAIDFSGSGDHDVIAAQVDEEIVVWQIFFTVSADTLLTFKDGASTALTGPLTLMAGGSVVLDPSKGGRDPSRPWFTATAGNAFVINTTGGQVSGRVYYTQRRPLSVP